MKKILVLLAIVGLSISAQAQETRTQATASLMALGMPGALATEVAGLATGLGIVTADMFVGTGVIVGATSRAANVTSASGTSALYALVSPASNDVASFIANGATAGGPIVDFLKTRATSGAQASTIVSASDVIGRMRFMGANGTGYDVGAEIIATVDSTPGASADMPGAIDFKVSPDGSATTASALKLTNDKLATFGGGIKSTATTLGWAARAGANTACSTTCGAGKGCAFGYDIGTTAIVDCSSALADSCACSF